METKKETKEQRIIKATKALCDFFIEKEKTKDILQDFRDGQSFAASEIKIFIEELENTKE